MRVTISGLSLLGRYVTSTWDETNATLGDCPADLSWVPLGTKPATILCCVQHPFCTSVAVGSTNNRFLWTSVSSATDLNSQNVAEKSQTSGSSLYTQLQRRGKRGKIHHYKDNQFLHYKQRKIYCVRDLGVGTKLLQIRQLKLYMPLCIWLVPQISSGKMKGVFQEMSMRTFCFPLLIFLCGAFFPILSGAVCGTYHSHYITLSVDC